MGKQGHSRSANIQKPCTLKVRRFREQGFGIGRMAVLSACGGGNSLRLGSSSRSLRRRLSGSRGCWSAGVLLGSGQVAGDLGFANVADHEFVRSQAGAALDVELNGFAGGFLFFLDGLVVGENGDGVLGFFLVALIEAHLDGANALRGLGLLQSEFIVVAMAATLEILDRKSTR